MAHRHDLADHRRLEADYDESSDIVTHVNFKSDPRTGQRRTRYEEKWKRKKFLGQGAFGSVWLETRTDVEGEVRAVKRINKTPGASLDFNPLDEIKVNAILSRSENDGLFVSFLGWYETYNSICLVMEYLGHSDLDNYLYKNGPLGETEASVVTKQLLEGLEVIHNANLIHRDLKPGNILIQQLSPWWVKISDFGISRQMESSPAVTFTGAGSTGYSAPEVLLNERTRQTAAIDMWSLGCVVYRSLLNQVPFQSRREIDMFRKDPGSFYQQIDSIAKLSSPVKDFFKALLVADPDHRSTVHDVSQLAWIVTPSQVCGSTAPIAGDSDGDSQLQTDGTQDTRTVIGRSGSKDPTQDEAILTLRPHNQNTQVLRHPHTSDNTSEDINMQMTTAESSASVLRNVMAEPPRQIADDDTSETTTWHAATTVVSELIPVQNGASENSVQISRSSPTDSAAPAFASSTRTEVGESAVKALLRYARDGDIRMVEKLLDVGISIEADYEGRTPLFEACQEGHEEVVRLLLDRCADLAGSQKHSFAPLHIAVFNKHDKIVKLLLDESADHSVATGSGETPLHIAAQQGSQTITQLLLDSGADHSPVNRKERWTPLHVAARDGHHGIAQLLLDKGADLSDQKNRYGWTPLYASASGGHDKVVQLLLDRGADPSPITPSRWTPLHAALYKNKNDSVVYHLVERGAGLSIITRDGFTALYLAVSNNNERMVRLLLDKGADPRTRSKAGQTPLALAMANDRPEIIEALAKKIDELEAAEKEILKGAAFRFGHWLGRAVVSTKSLVQDSKNGTGKSS